jgi:hypothetical protein
MSQVTLETNLTRVLVFNAAKAPQILAIKADPFLANLILESVALNGAPLIVVAFAAFSRPSLAEFSTARRNALAKSAYDGKSTAIMRKLPRDDAAGDRA